MAQAQPQSAVTALPGRGIKPLVSLRTHKRLAWKIFLVILVLGLPMALLKSKSFYTTNALLEVEPRYMKVVRDDGELNFASNTQYREYVQHQVKSLTRHDVLRDAIEATHGAATSVLGAGSETAQVNRLRNSLNVSVIPDTYLIDVEISGKSNKDLDVLLNTVARTFVEKMREERVYGSDERVKQLQQREDALQEDISRKNDELNQLASKMGIGIFTGKDQNPYEILLADLRKSFNDAKLKRIEAESKLEAFEKHGETESSAPSVLASVQQDHGLNNLKAKLQDRRSTLQLQLSGLRPAHPAYKEMAAEIEQIDKEIATQTQKVEDGVLKNMRSRYKNTVDQARQTESNLKTDIEDLEKKGVDYANLYNQANTITQDVSVLRKELDSIRDRLNYFAGEQNSFGFIRLVTPALPAEFPVDNRSKLLMMVVVAAIALSLALPIGIDMMDRRIHTVNDAEKILTLPSMGWLIERQDQTTREFGDDLLRRMAGTLINEFNRHGTNLFALSSVKAGGGATELSLSIGQTLTRLGYRTLVVEANAFRADTRYQSNRPGLQAYLDQHSSLDDCIVPAQDGLPDRISVGTNNKHLENIEHMKQMIEACRQQYDFVLVDLPPLLLSADTEILARKLEHLLVVVEAENIHVGELRRAKRQLERLGPAALGIIVNRVRPFDGGGYLNNLMIEYTAGRKLEDFYNRPQWLLKLEAGWTVLQARYPWLQSLVKKAEATLQDPRILKARARLEHAWAKAIQPETQAKILAMLSRLLQALKQELTRAGRLAIQALDQIMALPRRRQLQILAALAIASALLGLGWFLIDQPDAWVTQLLGSDTQKITLPTMPTEPPQTALPR